MRNPYSIKTMPFAFDGLVRIPVGPDPDKEWPYSENTKIWLKQWREDMARWPELPVDDTAMEEWFGMAMQVGGTLATQRWSNDYYDARRQLSEINKRRNNTNWVLGIIAISEAILITTLLIIMMK